MAFEKPVTKAMKARLEAERKARLEAEYALAIQKQQEEQRVRLEKARVEWESLLKTLPQELSRLEEIVTNELIPEWEQKASASIDWEELQEPICSTKWVLQFNEYERDEYTISSHYESSDTRRSGTSYERIVKERMPGSYWTSPLDPSGKEWFVSRASSPDGPIPPVQYPYCTIAGEINLWKEFPHDKARVDAIVKKIEEDREYYRNRIKEAKTALAGTVQEKVRYLLNQREADKLRNSMQKAWSIINPDKSKNLFWEDLLKSV